MTTTTTTMTRRKTKTTTRTRRTTFIEVARAFPFAPASERTLVAE